jgi:hypothetical protein
MDIIKENVSEFQIEDGDDYEEDKSDNGN